MFSFSCQHSFIVVFFTAFESQKSSSEVAREKSKNAGDAKSQLQAAVAKLSEEQLATFKVYQDSSPNSSAEDLIVVAGCIFRDENPPLPVCVNF